MKTLNAINKNLLSQVVGIALGIMAISTVHAATPTVWTTTIDAATYAGSTGTITFNDWGYKGPTGVGAMDFQVGSGFNSGNIGQIQHVVTKAADWISPDDGTPNVQGTVYGDMGGGEVFSNPNMDNNVNFYKWGYTTPANSTFSSMKIDTAGNYSIAKSDMSFGFYDRFQYRDTTLANPNQNFDTRINFQPYAITDAKGWCGSVLNADPNGVGMMAGQVTFDFAFDAYLFDATAATGAPVTQLVPGFIMRSYGDYVVDVATGGAVPDLQHYTGSAVGNNTNPNSIVNGVGGTLDPAYQNKVSFLGAGVVPTGVWVSADSFNGPGRTVADRKMRTDYNPTTGGTRTVWDVTIVPEGTSGAYLHLNSFAGYAYLLRADGTRTLDFIAPTGHSAYVATVPVPAAVWLFGSGLLGLVGVARRKKA